MREQVRPPKPHGKNAGRPDNAGFDKQARYATKKPHRERPARTGKPEHDRKAVATPAFGKKKKKKFRG
jgi:ATP-dependent RNA helicase DeaD